VRAFRLAGRIAGSTKPESSALYSACIYRTHGSPICTPLQVILSNGLKIG